MIPPVALLTVERLMARYASASEPEKAMIERLVDRLTQRRGGGGP